MSITTKDILALFDEDGEPLDDLKEVKSGEWENDYKNYHSKSVVYQHVASGRFFDVILNREGSYYSDYEYTAPDCYEVTPVEVTVTKYVHIK